MPPADDAQKIAMLAADAILGTLNLGFSDGLKLKGLYARYTADPGLRDRTVAALADELCARAPALAGKLCDAIAAKVGR